MRGFAVGVMGMSVDQFYNIRLGNFSEAVTAWSREKRNDRIHSGELARGAVIRLINMFLSRKDKITKLSQLWPMPWDDDESAIEDMATIGVNEHRKMMADLLNKIGK